MYPVGPVALCNPTNQLVQFVWVVLLCMLLATSIFWYFQALSVKHSMTLRCSLIGQRLDHVGDTAVEGYKTPA